VKTMHVREIITGDQLGLDFERVDFWSDVPVMDAIREAHAKPVNDPAALELSGITGEQWAALYEALGVDG